VTTVPAVPPSATVYERLRKQILDGTIPPGTVVPQLHLARELGVSRTPLREALRRLQEEGLVTAERHRRPRVATFDPDELESIYASRILLEALAMTLTAPLLTEGELDDLEQAIGEMDAAMARGELDVWETAHRRFHDQLVAHSGYLVETLRGLADRAYRYRRMYYMESDDRQRYTLGQADHRAILEACRARDAAEAARQLARHLGRTVIGILTDVSPETEPRMVRASLRLVLAGEERT
jgi:DNA-binding GntR family transcriptional regulator